MINISNVYVSDAKIITDKFAKNNYISYRGGAYESSPQTDTFESSNKEKKSRVGLILGSVAAVALTFGIICYCKGKGADGVEKKFGERMKDGWNELWHKGVKKAEDTVEEGAKKSGEVAEENVAKVEGVADGAAEKAEATAEGAVGNAEVVAEDGVAKVEGAVDDVVGKTETATKDSAAKAETVAGDSTVDKACETVSEKVGERAAELTEEDIEKVLIEELGEENAKIAMKPLVNVSQREFNEYIKLLEKDDVEPAVIDIVKGLYKGLPLADDISLIQITAYLKESIGVFEDYLGEDLYKKLVSKDSILYKKIGDVEIKEIYDYVSSVHVEDPNVKPIFDLFMSELKKESESGIKYRDWCVEGSPTEALREYYGIDLDDSYVNYFIKHTIKSFNESNPEKMTPIISPKGGKYMS